MKTSAVGTVTAIIFSFLVVIGVGIAQAGGSGTDRSVYGSTPPGLLQVVNAPEEDMDEQPLFVANAPEEDMDEQPFYVANAPEEDMGQEGSTGGGIFLYCCNGTDHRYR